MNIDDIKKSNGLVFKMSVPIFIELLLQMLVGNVDQIMIGKYNEALVGAIGNANIIINMIIIVLSVMSVSSTVLISRYLGAKDKYKISQVFSVSVFILGLISIFITVFILLFANKLLYLLAVPDIIFEQTKNYLLTVGSFTLVLGLYMTYASALRSYGFMKDVMFVSVFMNLINIAGNVILINGINLSSHMVIPGLGVLGAAISTSFSKIAGFLLLLFLFVKKTDIKLSLSYLKPFPYITMKNLLHIGIPSGLEELSYNMSQAVIMKFVNFFGTVVITTKVYCYILANVAYIYSVAISQASQIVVSYLIGSNNLKLASKKVWSTLFVSMAISLSVTFLLYINSDSILGIFTANPLILDLGKKILFIEFFLEIGRSINIVMVKSLIALEDVKFPAFMCIFSAWFFGAGLGYVLGIKLGMGLIGIWIAMAIDECFRGSVFIIRFSYMGWVKKVRNKKILEKRYLKSIPVKAA